MKTYKAHVAVGEVFGTHVVEHLLHAMRLSNAIKHGKRIAVGLVKGVRWRRHLVVCDLTLYETNALGGSEVEVFKAHFNLETQEWKDDRTFFGDVEKFLQDQKKDETETNP